MLQIIGWLGCVMLAVKLLEMAGNPALRLESGNLRESTKVAMSVGWISVFLFALWFYEQGANIQPPSTPVATGEFGAQLDCLDAARSSDQINACMR